MEEVVKPNEDLTRYILYPRHIRADNTVRWNVFIPNKDGETSVYRIMGISLEEIFDIGVEFVAKKRSKNLLGRVDIGVSKVFEQELTVIPDTKPHPRHANICGWPDDKSKQRLIALELEKYGQPHLI